MDLAVEPGVDFVRIIEDAVGSCAVLLAVIGRYWLTATDDRTGSRRLDNLQDFVRLEIVSAMRRNIRVIPMLVYGAHMPNAEELPEDLKPLVRRQALEISDQRWDYDVGTFTTAVDRIVGLRE